MEANIEEPMALDELSQHIGLVTAATGTPVQEISELCTDALLPADPPRACPPASVADQHADRGIRHWHAGFISAPHFSKCYRLVFGGTAQRRAPAGGHRATGELRL